jgi:hypothetical protein
MIPIPLKLRKEMEEDPEYQDCMLRAYPTHICGGRRNTREHAIMWKGARLQKKWAIISCCARGHEVDQYQDAHTMDKKMNIWVALNRATDEELVEISKAVDYIRERDRLNEIYGQYVPAEPRIMSGVINF